MILYLFNASRRPIIALATNFVFSIGKKCECSGYLSTTAFGNMSPMSLRVREGNSLLTSWPGLIRPRPDSCMT